MRQFIEKLANSSKEYGICDKETEKIRIYNYCWTIVSCNNHNFLYIENERERCSIKIYEDEYDILINVSEYIHKQTSEKFIEQLNNL